MSVQKKTQLHIYDEDIHLTCVFISIFVCISSSSNYCYHFKFLFLLRISFFQFSFHNFCFVCCEMNEKEENTVLRFLSTEKKTLEKMNNINKLTKVETRGSKKIFVNAFILLRYDI